MSRYDSVWDAIEDRPQQAAVMRLRSQLMQAIERYAQALDAPPGAIAGTLQIAEARLDDILAGRIETFSLDELAEIAVRTGLQVTLEIRDAA